MTRKEFTIRKVTFWLITLFNLVFFGWVLFFMFDWIIKDKAMALPGVILGILTVFGPMTYWLYKALLTNDRED